MQAHGLRIRSGLMRRRRMTILKHGPLRPSPYRSSRHHCPLKLTRLAMAQSLQIDGENIRQAQSTRRCMMHEGLLLVRHPDANSDVKIEFVIGFSFSDIPKGSAVIFANQISAWSLFDNQHLANVAKAHNCMNAKIIIRKNRILRFEARTLEWSRPKQCWRRGFKLNGPVERCLVRSELHGQNSWQVCSFGASMRLDKPKGFIDSTRDLGE
jgi:hypothetical protein